MDITYGKMERKDLKECAAIAAGAFQTYEYFSIYIPDDSRRERFLDKLILCEFKANFGLPHTVILTAQSGGKTVAVCHLCEPGFVKPSDWAYVRNGWLGVQSTGGTKDVKAWNEMQEKASEPCHNLGDIWYISLLTVAPDFEGKGIGSRMLNDYVFPYIREHGGSSVCLFTNSQQNRRFYERNGFTEFDSRSFDYNGKSIGNWSYRRNL